jgi:hypothetical protein
VTMPGQRVQRPMTHQYDPKMGSHNLSAEQKYITKSNSQQAPNQNRAFTTPGRQYPYACRQLEAGRCSFISTFQEQKTTKQPIERTHSLVVYATGNIGEKCLFSYNCCSENHVLIEDSGRLSYKPTAARIFTRPLPTALETLRQTVS